jgi:pimeloyl-ACP methyl ester carboxylesterase
MNRTPFTRQRCARLLAAVVAAVASSTGLSAPAHAMAPKPSIASACFTAAGPDGNPYRIYGRRFVVGKPTRSTPAIVLVHGVQSDARVWDATPGWSVARRLAHAGYVVFAYDRLGCRHSPYTGPGGGNALTVGAQQAVLHDVIAQVRRGGYRAGRSTATCGSSAPTHKSRYASRRVAVIGHSAGGFIVSSYPGRYHDVVAMVQANAPSGQFSTDPPGNAALVSQSAPPAHGSMADKYGPIGDAWTDGTPPAAPAGFSYPNATRLACEDFNLWRPGAVKSFATSSCDPATFTATPAGESASFVEQAVLNTALIRRTGDIPVLLAGSDHDAIMPGNANALELSAWQEDCRCDVSQFILADTGHAFMGHRSLVAWTTGVVRWLRRNDVDARPPAGRVRG